MNGQRRTATLCVHIDPRLFDAVLDFTGEVVEVADTLTNLGLNEEAGRLLGALDRLDDADEDWT
jgi:hypothetical protein